MKKVQKFLFFALFFALFSLENLQAQCGSLSFGTPTVTSNGVEVEVLFTTTTATSFLDFEVYVTFSNSSTNVDFGLTSGENGLITLEGNNDRIVEIHEDGTASFSSGTTVIATINFVIADNQSTNISFTTIANILSGGAGSCTPSNTSFTNIPYTPPTFTLGGVTEHQPSGYDTKVPDVTVSIVPDSGTPDSELTNAQGQYSFDVSAGCAHTVSATKVGDPGCGVTSSDIDRLHDHIQFVDLFTHPWEHIAADASGNDTISTYDKVLIQKTILYGNGSTNYFEDSWVFMPKTEYQSLPLPPFDSTGLLYNVELDVAGLTSNSDNNFFWGIKVGDVNGAGCFPSQYGGALVEDNPNNKIENQAENHRNSSTVQMPLITAFKNQEVLIPIYANTFKNQSVLALGLQFDTELVEVMDIVNANLDNFSRDAYSINYDRAGAVDVLWTTEQREGLSLLPTQPLFYIAVRAKQTFVSLEELATLRYDRVDNKIYKSGPDEGEHLGLAFINQRTNIRNTTNHSSNHAILSPNPFTK